MRIRATNQYAKRTLTITEAAAILGIGRNQAYEAARNGTLPVITFGHGKNGKPTRYLVPRAALERLLSEGEEAAPTAQRRGKGETTL